MRRFVLFALLFATACYSYAPIEESSAPVGTSVRARVTPSAATRIAPLINAAETRVLVGTLIQNGKEGMIVEIPTIIPAAIGTSI